MELGLSLNPSKLFLDYTEIITLHGACTKNLPAYLIMEYGESGDLNHLLHETDNPYNLNDIIS